MILGVTVKLKHTGEEIKIFRKISPVINNVPLGENSWHSFWFFKN